MQRLIGTDHPALWSQALQGLPHGYWHTVEACKALEEGTGLPVYLYACEESGGSRSACLFAERRWGDHVDVFTPGGFSGFIGNGDTAILRHRWDTFVADRGYVCGYFALHPELANPLLHTNLDVSNTLYILDLSDGGSAALGRMDREVFRLLRRWRSAGGEVVEDRGLVKRFILDNYATFMASVGANRRALWAPETVEAMLNDDNVILAGCADDRGLCSAYTFATSEWGADAHLNLSIRSGREFISPLVEWGVVTLAGRGIPWLNLGGGVVAGDAVARAKRRFGPLQAPLSVAREIYRPAAYLDLCAQRPLDNASNYFPEYRS